MALPDGGDDEAPIAPAWAGDWQARLRERLRSNNCDSVSAFLALHPAEPHLSVTKHLGPDVAAVQIQWAQFDEARDGGRLREAAADALTREIVARVKKGWKRGIHFDRQRAAAYGSWLSVAVCRVAAAQRERHEARLEAVWDALEALPPPDGWLPSSPDDPVVCAAFDRGWPEGVA